MSPVVVPEKEINHEEMTRQLFDLKAQQWIPFLGSGVSASAAPVSQAQSRQTNQRISHSVDYLRQDLGFNEASLFFLQSAMELALELERLAQLPPRNLYQDLVEREYPPSAAEFTAVFRGNLSAFEAAAGTLMQRLRYHPGAVHLTDLEPEKTVQVRELTQDFLDRLAPLAGISAPPLSVMSAHFELTQTRTTILQRIGEILKNKTRFTTTHKMIARLAEAHLAAKKAHFLIITTNYDCLMEEALEKRPDRYSVPYVVLNTSKQGKNQLNVRARFGNMNDSMRKRFERANPFKPLEPPGKYDLKIPEPEEPDETEVPPRHLVVIYKLHGCIYDVLQCPRINGSGECMPCPHDGIVLSDEDYIGSIASLAGNDGFMPAIVTELVRKSRAKILFLGYSLKDWNVRAFLRVMDNQIDANERRSAPTRDPDCAIVHNLSRLEETFFLKNNINVWITDLNAFAAELGAWATAYRIPP